MNRAKTLAEWWAHVAKHDATVWASIYSDGVILYLMVSPQTQFELEEVLGDRVTERARTDDGLGGVIILPVERFPKTFDRIQRFLRKRPQRRRGSIKMFSDRLMFNDNRERDHHTIDSFCGLCARVLEDRSREA